MMSFSLSCTEPTKVDADTMTTNEVKEDEKAKLLFQEALARAEEAEAKVKALQEEGESIK